MAQFRPEGGGTEAGVSVMTFKIGDRVKPTSQTLKINRQYKRFSRSIVIQTSGDGEDQHIKVDSYGYWMSSERFELDGPRDDPYTLDAI